MVLEIDRENNMKPSAKMRSVAAQKALALFALCLALASGIDLGQCAEREESVSSANSAEERIDGVALFLKWASGSAFPKEGFIRYATRDYYDVKVISTLPLKIQFTPRKDGSFREKTFEASWQNGDFYCKETTPTNARSDPSNSDGAENQNRDTFNSRKGKSGDFYWRAFNKELSSYSRENNARTNINANQESQFSFPDYVEDDFKRIKEIFALEVGSIEQLRFDREKGRFWGVADKDVISGDPEFNEDNTIATVIFSSENIKKRFIYKEWTNIPGLGYFPKIIELSDALPDKPLDGFLLSGEIELLEFRPSIWPKVGNPFHYQAHIDEDLYKKYVYIDNMEYSMRGTNLVPIVTLPPSESWNSAVMIIFLLGILVMLFFGVYRDRKEISNNRKFNN